MVDIWTSEDEKLLLELGADADASTVGGRPSDASLPSEAPRFGSKVSAGSSAGRSSRRSSLRSLDSVTSLLEKLERPQKSVAESRRTQEPQLLDLQEQEELPRGADEHIIEEKPLPELNLSPLLGTEEQKDDEAEALKQNLKKLEVQMGLQEEEQQERGKRLELQIAELQQQRTEWVAATQSLQSKGQEEQKGDEAEVLKQNLKKLEVQMGLQQEEQQERAKCLESKVEESLQLRTEWVAALQGLQSKEQELGRLRAHLTAQREPSTSAVNKQNFRRKFEDLQDKFEAELAERQEQFDRNERLAAEAAAQEIASCRQNEEMEEKHQQLELQLLQQQRLLEEQQQQRELLTAELQQARCQEMTSPFNKLREGRAASRAVEPGESLLSNEKFVEEHWEQQHGVILALEQQRCDEFENRNREQLQEIRRLQNEMRSLKDSETLAAAESERQSQCRHQQLEAHQEIRCRSQVTLLEQAQLQETQQVKRELQQLLEEQQRSHQQSEEHLEFRVVEVEKQKSFWHQRSEQQSQEIQDLHSEVQSSADAEVRRTTAEAKARVQENRELSEELQMATDELAELQKALAEQRSAERLSANEQATFRAELKELLQSHEESEESMADLMVSRELQEAREELNMLHEELHMAGAQVETAAWCGAEPDSPASAAASVVLRKDHEEELTVMQANLKELRRAENALQVAVAGHRERLDAATAAEAEALQRLEAARRSEQRMELAMNEGQVARLHLKERLRTQSQLHQEAMDGQQREELEMRRLLLANQKAQEEFREQEEQWELRRQEELVEFQELQSRIESFEHGEAHLEIRVHSRLTQFEQEELQEVQQAKQQMSEELAEHQRLHGRELARRSELCKAAQGRHEALETTAEELEKQRSFWQRRSDEEVQELLQLQSEMKNVRDSEALLAADWEKAMHMALRQQQMEAHEEIRSARDELQRAIEALQSEEEKSQEMQKVAERELMATRAASQQELKHAENELQLSLVQERGRVDALLSAEADCAKQLEQFQRKEKQWEDLMGENQAAQRRLEEELKARNQLCDEAAEALRQNLKDLEVQMELQGEHHEREKRLESKISELQTLRAEWLEATRAQLQSKDQEINELRGHLSTAVGEQLQTSPVNKQKFRRKLEELQDTFEAELAESRTSLLLQETASCEQNEEMEARQHELERQLLQQQQVLEELTLQRDDGQRHRETLEEQLQQLTEAAQRAAASEACEAQSSTCSPGQVESLEVTLLVPKSPEDEASLTTSPFNKQTRSDRGEPSNACGSDASPAAGEAEAMEVQRLREELNGSQEQVAHLTAEVSTWQDRSEAQQRDLTQLRGDFKRLKSSKAQAATFTTLNHTQAHEAINVLLDELASAKQDLGSELVAARGLVQEELQCYNASRLEQHAKFQGELEEQELQNCERLQRLQSLQEEHELQSRERLRGEEAEFQLLQERFQGLQEEYHLAMDRQPLAEAEAPPPPPERRKRKPSRLSVEATLVEPPELVEEPKVATREREAEDFFRMQDYADLLLQHGQYDQAEDVQNYISDISTRNFGEEDRQTIMTRLSVVSTLQLQGKVVEAEAGRRSTLRLAQRSLREDDPLLVNEAIAVSSVPLLSREVSAVSMASPLAAPGCAPGCASRTLLSEGMEQHVMLSGRFNDEEVVRYMKTFKSALEDRGLRTFMVNCGLGDDFSHETMIGLYHAWAMVVFGTAEYGAKTGAGYETYYELQYAHQKRLALIPLQLCVTWPPAPKDKDGGSWGAAQNRFVLRESLMREKDIKMEKPEEMAAKIARRLLDAAACDFNKDPGQRTSDLPKQPLKTEEEQEAEKVLHQQELLQNCRRQEGRCAEIEERYAKLLEEHQEAQAHGTCDLRLVHQSQLQLEEQSATYRLAREEWQNELCSLRETLQQASEEKLVLEEKLASKEKECREACDRLGTLWSHCLQSQEECRVQSQLLNGGLRRNLEEQQEAALVLQQTVKAKEQELLLAEFNLSCCRQEWSLEEEQFKMQLERGVLSDKRREEEAEEWKKEEARRFQRELLRQESMLAKEQQELQQEFWLEKQNLLEKVTEAEFAQEHALQAERLRGANAAAQQQQEEEKRRQALEARHQAEVLRLRSRYEKALLKSSGEQARLLTRYEREKEEWAADWRELNGLIEPMLQGSQAAEAQLISRQVAAQEGMDLFHRFAQLKELQLVELRQSSRSEAGADSSRVRRTEELPRCWQVEEKMDDAPEASAPGG